MSNTIYNLGVVKKDQGFFVEAESLFQDCLAMKHRLFGANADHIEIATTMEILARTLHARGVIVEAALNVWK